MDTASLLFTCFRRSRQFLSLIVVVVAQFTIAIVSAICRTLIIARHWQSFLHLILVFIADVLPTRTYFHFLLHLCLLLIAAGFVFLLSAFCIVAIFAMVIKRKFLLFHTFTFSNKLLSFSIHTLLPYWMVYTLLNEVYCHELILYKYIYTHSEANRTCSGICPPSTKFNLWGRNPKWTFAEKADFSFVFSSPDFLLFHKIFL